MDGARGIQCDGDDGRVFIDLRDTVRLRRSLTQKMSGFIVTQNDQQSGKFKKLKNSSRLEIAGDLLQKDVKKVRKRSLGFFSVQPVTAHRRWYIKSDSAECATVKVCSSI